MLLGLDILSFTTKEVAILASVFQGASHVISRDELRQVPTRVQTHLSYPSRKLSKQTAIHRQWRHSPPHSSVYTNPLYMGGAEHASGCL